MWGFESDLIDKSNYMYSRVAIPEELPQDDRKAPECYVPRCQRQRAT